jgi:hypothetical protein
VNNTEYRTSTSASSEIKRLKREIETHRALASDFYEELKTHISYLRTSEGSSGGVDEKKGRFKRIGVILEELKEEYWNLTDLLLEFNGIEILDNQLPEVGIRLVRDLIGILNEMDPTVRNTHKSLRFTKFSSVGTDLYSMANNRKFNELNEVLSKLSTEIKTISDQLEDLKQKRIL